MPLPCLSVMMLGVQQLVNADPTQARRQLVETHKLIKSQQDRHEETMARVRVHTASYVFRAVFVFTLPSVDASL